MRRLLLLLPVLAFLLAFAPGSASAAHRVPGPSWNPTGAYVNTFNAPFTSIGINPKYETTWWPGAQNSFFTACYLPSHVTQPGDGFLHLLLTQDSSSCYGKTLPFSGAVADTHSSFHQLGGAFEARVNLPCNASGQIYGWPAVWSDSDNFAAEMDWAEGGNIASGVMGGLSAHLHYNGGNADYVAPSPLCGWHKFGVQWNTSGQTATFYWDSKPVFGPVNFPAGQNSDYLIFDYQAGCGNVACTIPPPASGATMLVDWERVWK